MASDAGVQLLIPGLASIEDDDLDQLRAAVATLEHSSLATRIGAALGRQLDVASDLLPAPVLSVVNKATMKALRAALRAAVKSLPGQQAEMPANRLHLTLAALSGAAGGALGLASLPIELPLSTTIMLRSIAEIARQEGEDLTDPQAVLACLEVFALGGGDREAGPASDSSYLAVRAMLAKSVSEAARYIVQRGAGNEAAPAVVRLLSQIASRFGVVVGQKAMTQAVPVLGAVTGGVINAAFTSHFQALAKAHFTVRRLERRYGAETVRSLFLDLQRGT